MPGCPDATALEELATGKLPAAQRIVLMRHVDGCQACAELVGELARLYGSADPALADTQLAEVKRIDPMGSELGRYRLVRRIGEGGMGVVFEAHDPELERRVAIKLLHPQLDEEAASLRARLLREARAMAKLAHPNVVSVFDVGRIGQQVFVAMELVEGTTLSRWLSQQRPSRQQIIDAFVQAGHGLEAAHAVGLVHRDFKPDNVLIGTDGRARVTDFGLARPHETGVAAPVSLPSGVDVMHTAPGALIGTPAYMAPEQLRGEIADAHSDQFAFSVALYEAVCGRRPFAGDTLEALSQEVALGRILPTPGGTPRWLARVLKRGLSAKREDRFSSMRELLGELGRDRDRPRRWFWVIGAMAIGATTAVVLLKWVTASLSPAPSASAAAAADACDAESARVEQAWNDPRRAELARRLATASPGRGKDVAARVTRVLDDWAQHWRHGRVQLCAQKPEATLATGRLACLDERMRRFEALLGEIVGANISSAERALAAAEALPSADDCSQEARARGAPAAPSTKDQARVELLRGDVARAYALAAMGRVDDARDAAAKVLADSEALGYAPLTAEAALASGMVAWRRGEVDRAAELCGRAAGLAKVAHHDEVMTEAGLALVALLGAEQLHPADADRWVKLVKADAERYGDRSLAARLAVAVAAMKDSIAAHEDAKASLDEALAVRRQLHGDEHPDVAATLLLVSAEHLERDEPEPALERARLALAIYERVAGKDDLRTAAAEAAVGRALAALGKHSDALPHLKRALRVRLLALPLLDDLPTAESQEDIGRTYEALAQNDEARKAYEQSASRRRERPELALSLARQADMLARDGELDDAIELHQQAVAHLEAMYGAKDARIVNALRGLGLANARAGRYARARNALERALEIVVAQIGYGPLSGLVEVDLARAAIDAKRDADALHHFDEAYIWLVSGFGQYHPRSLANVLMRADLAWQLGQRDYAGRLYGSVGPSLAKQVGNDHPDVVRARERASP